MPMGCLAGGVGARRPRFQSQHGFRTNSEIMRKQVVGKWPTEVTARLDLVFAEAPVPVEGKSDVDDIFYPAYYEVGGKPGNTPLNDMTAQSNQSTEFAPYDSQTPVKRTGSGKRAPHPQVHAIRRRRPAVKHCVRSLPLSSASAVNTLTPAAGATVHTSTAASTCRRRKALDMDSTARRQESTVHYSTGDCVTILDSTVEDWASGADVCIFSGRGNSFFSAVVERLSRQRQSYCEIDVPSTGDVASFPVPGNYVRDDDPRANADIHEFFWHHVVVDGERSPTERYEEHRIDPGRGRRDEDDTPCRGPDHEPENRGARWFERSRSCTSDAPNRDDHASSPARI
ncbi:hypothetical protein ZWY2020_052872 [Hordeum vulgare]|nr:hypothetical protein ZWY2020_052872 [Hordeum vulgare]